MPFWSLMVSKRQAWQPRRCASCQMQLKVYSLSETLNGLMCQIRLTSSNFPLGSFVLLWKILCRLQNYMALPVVTNNIFYKYIISLSSLSLLVLISVSKLHFTKAERKPRNFPQKMKLSGEVHHHPDLPTKVLKESILCPLTIIQGQPRDHCI